MVTAHNTFQQPEAIKPAEFTAAKTTDGGFTATLPPKSVVVLEVRTSSTCLPLSAATRGQDDEPRAHYPQKPPA